jgi:hypothetical protein
VHSFSFSVGRKFTFFDLCVHVILAWEGNGVGSGWLASVGGVAFDGQVLNLCGVGTINHVNGEGDEQSRL